MRRIILWKGYHSKEIAELIATTWKEENLLILYPPKFDDLSFVNLLPEGSLEFAGHWDTRLTVDLPKRNTAPLFPENPIFGIFSTGTTEKPREKSSRKLVLYSKKNIESSLHAILSLFDDKKFDSVFCYPQPFHTFGLILGYMQCLLSGRQLVPIEGPYSEQQHEQWCGFDKQSLMTLGTPTHFKDLIAYCEKQKLSPRPTYASIVGAAQVEVSLWKSQRDYLKILNPSVGYGATEASPGITHLPPGLEPKEDGEVGFPLSHLRVSLTERGIDFSGASVCLASIQKGNLEFPSRILIRDRLEKRADGVLVYRGRFELTLNRGGEKFNLEEIEMLLKKRFELEAVCVSIPHERLGEELGILARNIEVRPQEVYAVLKEIYGRDFDSHFFHSVEALPVNASFKVDRARCRETIEAHV